jgi:nicotinamide-nucleotide amidase
MLAELITIGDELLIGQVINTNASYIGEQLIQYGYRLDRVTTVGDEKDKIIKAIDKAVKDYDLIFITGGLGPTHDDITKKVLCDYFNTELIMDNEVLEHVKSIAKKWKNRLKLNEEQAMIPKNCRVLFNNAGTAPGMHFIIDNKNIFVTPGVPHEMKYIFEYHILPLLKSKQDGFIHTKTFLIAGLGESALFDKLENVTEITKLVEVAFLPSPRGVRLRIISKGSDEKEVLEKLQYSEKFIRDRASEYIYGEGSIEIEELIAGILTEKKLKISTAESCTGGFLSNRITNIPGSSVYFDRGVITYSNESKNELLNIPMDIITANGAVSEIVAKMMAEKVREISGSDIGLSTTGIAGPSGGTPEKPVGTIWIGYSDKNKSYAKQFYLGDNRLVFKERATQNALIILQKELKDF